MSKKHSANTRTVGGRHKHRSRKSARAMRAMIIGIAILLVLFAAAVIFLTGCAAPHKQQRATSGQSGGAVQEQQARGGDVAEQSTIESAPMTTVIVPAAYDAAAVDAAIAAANEAKAEMSGHQFKRIDSLVNIVDSLRKISGPAAQSKAEELVAFIPSLVEDEAKAARLRLVIPGEWLYVDTARSDESPEVNAVEQKHLTFNKDGTAFFMESKIGQSGQFLKEDWEFRSYGTYDFRGDTVIIAVSRFQTVRQIFEKGAPKEGGAIEWKREEHPTSDVQITDGSQDRRVTYDVLKDDFKQIKKF